MWLLSKSHLTIELKVDIHNIFIRVFHITTFAIYTKLHSCIDPLKMSLKLSEGDISFLQEFIKFTKVKIWVVVVGNEWWLMGIYYLKLVLKMLKLVEMLKLMLN